MGGIVIAALSEALINNLLVQKIFRVGNNLPQEFFPEVGKSKNKNIINLRNYLRMNTLIESESFFIEFNEKLYECLPMEKNGRMIYQIKFPSSSIYLTEAKSQNGEKFWTAIPPDSKLNHIIPILGKQIENKKS